MGGLTYGYLSPPLTAINVVSIPADDEDSNSSSSLSDSDDDDDDDEGEDEEDAAQESWDLGACPPGCDQQLYDWVVEMRLQR